MQKKIRTTLAAKFSLTFALLIIITILAIGFAVRQSVVTEFTNTYRRNVQSALNSIQRELANREDIIKNQLRELSFRLSEDNEFRLYVTALKENHQPYVVDYASRYMKTMGLDALEIMDRKGIVLSSGHLRNSFGKSSANLLYNLRTKKFNEAIVWFHNFEGTFPALAALDSLITGSTKFYIIGGIEINPALLSSINQDTTNFLITKFNNSFISSAPEFFIPAQSKQLTSAAGDTLLQRLSINYTKGSFRIPVVFPNNNSTADFFLFHPKSELTALLDKLQRTISYITAVGIFIAIILSISRTRIITKPLKKLAGEASKLSLENLELNFTTNSKDEVGLLSEALHNMVKRLHQSRIELADAEQKAARAEIARHVNHDLRNGFIPIRHVLDHWEEVAEKEPSSLVTVFNDRKVTVKESLEYLQNLSRLYTRIQPGLTLEPVQINSEVCKLVKSYKDFQGHRINFEINQDPSNPLVFADKIQLRRALENILRNAVEAIPQNGEIKISTKLNENNVIILCKDTGKGIPAYIKEKLFTSNITTKKDGTGLGLANVKRIIDDMDGRLKIESEENNGTTVVIKLPKYKNKFVEKK